MEDSACLVGLELDTSNFVAENLPLMPPFYKGVSYNPQVYSQQGGRRDWLLLTDFFALIRCLQKTLPENGVRVNKDSFAVLDASYYWFVNLLREESVQIKSGSAGEAAEALVSFLLNATREFKGSAAFEAARVRNAYLRAVANQFPVELRPKVITLTEIWEDPQFPECLASILPLFCKKEIGGYWRVFNSVNYERYMPYSPWVTPLIAGEEIFLSKVRSFRGNLVPADEDAWTKIINLACKKANAPEYSFLLYKRKVSKKLPYDSVPFYSDSEAEILSKISSPNALSSGLPELLLQFISPFQTLDLGCLLREARKGNFKPAAKEIFEFSKKVDADAEILLGESSSSPIVNFSYPSFFGWR